MRLFNLGVAACGGQAATGFAPTALHSCAYLRTNAPRLPHP